MQRCEQGVGMATEWYHHVAALAKQRQEQDSCTGYGSVIRKGMIQGH